MPATVPGKASPLRRGVAAPRRRQVEKRRYNRSVGIRAKIHELVDELPEEELEELHRVAKARWAKLRLKEAPASDEHRSFLEAAEKFIGACEGPPDLSTNPDYMEGFV